MKVGPRRYFATGGLAVVRIESHDEVDGVILGRSSFPVWLDAVAKHVPRLYLLLPIDRTLRASQATVGWAGYRLRPEDRLYSLSSCVGYVRGCLNTPHLLVNLLRLRMRTRLVVARIPEHLHFFVLPLLHLLRFHIVIWLVHDRDGTYAAEHARREHLTLKDRAALLANRLTGWMERRYLRKSFVVANGSALQSKVLALGNVSSRVKVVVSTNLSRDVIPAVCPSRSLGATLTILYVGRIAVDKGLSDLIEAIAILVADQTLGRKLIVRIVGPSVPDELSRIQAQALERRVAGRLQFLGPVPFGPELFKLFKTADVFVLPSWVEGTPRVLVEAMAFGLPIVATSVGGVPDVVIDRENGILVPPHSPADLASAIVALLRDEKKYSDIVRNNWLRARAFTVEDFAAEFIRYVEYVAVETNI